jgi:hypothetical protein
VHHGVCVMCVAHFKKSHIVILYNTPDKHHTANVGTVY